MAKDFDSDVAGSGPRQLDDEGALEEVQVYPADGMYSETAAALLAATDDPRLVRVEFDGSFTVPKAVADKAKLPEGSTKTDAQEQSAQDKVVHPAGTTAEKGEAAGSGSRQKVEQPAGLSDQAPVASDGDAPRKAPAKKAAAKRPARKAAAKKAPAKAAAK